MAIQVSPFALKKKFRKLANEWKARKSHSSCVEDMAMHPAYQQIIGIGPDAIPLLLAELEAETNHWFWALHALTGVNPVPRQSRGDIKKMAVAWLRWGKKKGY